MDLTLADVSVFKYILNRWHALAEVREAKLLELGSGDVHVEILTLGESLAVNFSLMGSGKNSLGLLALGSESSHGSCISSDVDSSLLLELSDAVVDKHIVEIFSSQVGVSIGSLDLENSIFDTEERHIKGATTKIKDENIALSRTFLLVQPVGNSGGCGLVDDTENVKTGDDSGILGGLPLGVVEVGGDGDDSVLDLGAQVGLGGLLHLGQDHGGALLGGEPLGLVLVLDLQLGPSALLHHGEGPMLHVRLNCGVIELAADQPLGVEDSVGGVDSNLDIFTI